MKEERLRILKMVEDNKISIEEADQLLELLSKEKFKKVNKRKPRFIKVLVQEEGKKKVDITVPLIFARTLIKFIPKSAKVSLSEQEIDIEGIISSVKDFDGPSTLVNIDDGESKIIISLE